MPERYEPEVVYRTVELFLDQEKIKRSASDIANQVNKEFKPSRPLTRETVYKVISQAKADGFIRLVPPVNRQLKKQLEDRFQQCYGKITVVSTYDKSHNWKVSEVAAERAIELIQKIGETRATKTVGLGLGPGRATLDFCKYLGARIKSEILFPKLRLVAISAGCPARLPEYESSSFFHLFAQEQVEEKIGIFAESLVRGRDLSRIKRTPGVHEAFEAKSQDIIDIVVTSMGDFSDPHDLLRMFLHDAGMKADEIKNKGWIGNVQYRPFTANGPVVEGSKEWRAVTLFEIKDLVAMSGRSNKYVILIARQCGLCERTRAKTLLPLLTNPELRVFSDLILDAATAEELLRWP